MTVIESLFQMVEQLATKMELFISGGTCTGRIYEVVDFKEFVP